MRTTDYSAIFRHLKSYIPDTGERLEVKQPTLAQEGLAVGSGVLDVVYGAMPFENVSTESMAHLCNEVVRALKPGGFFMFFGRIDSSGGVFDEANVRRYVRFFEIVLLREDQSDGVSYCCFVGKKPLHSKRFEYALPYVGAIVERMDGDERQVLLQTRWKPHADPLYTGTLEFPAGILDEPYESIYDALAREVREETGLEVVAIRGHDRTKIYAPPEKGESFAFRPFCCTQQLKGGCPWIGYVFVCEVSGGEPAVQLSETRGVQWCAVDEVRALFEMRPERFFGLELPAWEYYFDSLK